MLKRNLTNTNSNIYTLILEAFDQIKKQREKLTQDITTSSTTEITEKTSTTSTAAQKEMEQVMYTEETLPEMQYEEEEGEEEGRIHNVCFAKSIIMCKVEIVSDLKSSFRDSERISFNKVVFYF